MNKDGEQSMATSRLRMKMRELLTAAGGIGLLLLGSPTAASAVEIRAPFWRVGGGFETSLLINNTQPWRITAQLVVYDHEGAPHSGAGCRTGAAGEQGRRPGCMDRWS